jgi:hypothetical protein
MRKRDDLSFDEVGAAVRQEARDTIAFRRCLWFSTYRIHHRCAERFRDRRCFLLGDAAHIHSPAGAQGMNTGLQDAYNLAWKLALVISGRADAALLDTYEQERIPVAQRLVRTTDRFFQVIVADGWFGKIFRTAIMARVAAFAMTRQSVRDLAFRTISQIGIRYRRSPLSRTLPGAPPAGPAAGDRFPWLQLRMKPGGAVEDLFDRLDDTRYNLLVIAQPATAAPSGLGDLVRVHEIPADDHNTRALAAARISGPCFHLLRPDGHVGLAGFRLEPSAIERYLADSGIRPGTGEGR